MSDKKLWDEFVALEKDHEALRAENESMKKQEPYIWYDDETGETYTPEIIADCGLDKSELRPLYAEAGAQPAPSFADAYQGAMEEVAIWKKRALEAEELNRKFIAEINDPTYMGEPAQPAPSVPDSYAEGIETVAAMLQSKADEHAKEHGYDDLGSLSFGSGRDGQNKMDYYTDLLEIADEVRAMVAAAPEAKP